MEKIENISTELPKELLSTFTLTTHLLLPTKTKTRSSHREHPPDYYHNAVVGGTTAADIISETTITISAVNNKNSSNHTNSNYGNEYWPTPCTSTKSTVITNKTTTSINSKNNNLILQQQQLQHKHKSTTTALNKGFGDDDNTQICKITKTEDSLLSLSDTLPTAVTATATSDITKLSSPAYRVSHHRKNKCNSNENLFTTLTSVLRQVIKLYTTAADSPLKTKRSLHFKVASLSIPTNKTTTAARCKAAATTSTRTKFRLLPSLGATSFFTLLTFVCLETVLLSTVSNCAKTFYMHWNTSNSIFRIDNTDHIIDVNKGNLAFEFDQVHIICPVYEPGTYENETEKYIIYNVSKVEYETCRITNADPRVIAICDKPQKLMFFTITFRPFTPQPGGLEFLPGNDYYFISTSSKDDLYRRIGGRCSTNNMKVVFKVCCASEEKNKTMVTIGAGSSDGTAGGSGVDNSGAGGEPINVDVNSPINVHQQHMNNIKTIGINGVNTGLIPGSGINMNGGNGGNNGIQLKPINGASGTSINTNIDQFNRIPIQTNGINVIGNNIGGGVGLGSHGGSGIMLTPGGINMKPISVGEAGAGQYPSHPGQTGIRINNVASQQHHPSHKSNNNNNNDDQYDKHPNEVVKNEELTYNSAASSVHGNCRWNKQLSASIHTTLLTVKSIITKTTTFTAVTINTYDSSSDFGSMSSYIFNSSSNISRSSRSIKNTIFIGDLKVFNEIRKFKNLILEINPIILLISLVTLIIVMYYLFVYPLSFSMLYLLTSSLRTLFTAKTHSLSAISSPSLLSSSSSTAYEIVFDSKKSYMRIYNRKTLGNGKVSNINKNFR